MNIQLGLFQAVINIDKKYFRHFSTRRQTGGELVRFLYYLCTGYPMKRTVAILVSVLLTVAAGAQIRHPRGVPMYYEVHDGDTMFFDTIEPTWCFPKGRGMKKGDWRQYYKTVYNFNKIYPYALVGRKMMAQVDSTLAADVSKRSERNRYINDVERELFRLFEKDIRNMTISQGVLLLRLVDRECGMSGFEIIKTYESGFSANFWQLVAKIFSQDLKTRYDPKGKDSRTEELIKIWDSGQWDAFYFSVFMELPRKTVIKTEHLNSEVKKK